jgi:hypothetical protein
MTDTAHKYLFEVLYERERETTARLRAINAELVAALELAKRIILTGGSRTGDADNIIDAALAKAKGA